MMSLYSSKPTCGNFDRQDDLFWYVENWFPFLKNLSLAINNKIDEETNQLQKFERSGEPVKWKVSVSWTMFWQCISPLTLSRSKISFTIIGHQMYWLLLRPLEVSIIYYLVFSYLAWFVCKGPWLTWCFAIVPYLSTASCIPCHGHLFLPSGIPRSIFGYYHSLGTCFWFTSVLIIKHIQFGLQLYSITSLIPSAFPSMVLKRYLLFASLLCGTLFCYCRFKIINAN